MITYKGNPLVQGKHFIYENEVIEYKSKVYGNQYLFDLNGTDLILHESEVQGLQSLLEHSLLSEQEDSDDLYQIISSYTDKQLDLCHNCPSKDLWNELLNSFQEELNDLSKRGHAYQTTTNKIDGNDTYLLEVIQDFLDDTKYNISEASLPNIYSQISNFIYNINTICKDKIKRK